MTSKRKDPFVQNFSLIMRLTLILMIVSVFSAFSNGYAQKTKLNLKVQNSQVKDVLNQIENQSEFFFMFDNKQVDVERRIDLDVSSLSVEKVLQLLFEGTDVDYKVVNRQILLFKNGSAANQSQPTQPTKKVTGKVVDSTGAPLTGVSIVIKGTNNGTVSDANGNYSLGSVPENATLLFSFIGMKNQELPAQNKSVINEK